MNYLRHCLFLIVFLQAPLLAAKEKLMVFINPNAGGGEAKSYYDEQVKPLLSQKHDIWEYCDANVNVVKAAIDGVGDELLTFKGIVGVGGDGTIHEIFKALQGSKFGHEALQKIAIGHIPRGSGNALARSVYAQDCRDDNYSAAALAHGILKGKTSSLDLWSYTTNNKEAGIFFLGISYGVISDIDIGSEWLRPYLGSWRFDAYGGYQWLRNRQYGYRLEYSQNGVSKQQGPYTREIWIMNIPYASEAVRVVPQAKLDDGQLHIMSVTSETSFIELYTFLQSLSAGTVHTLPFVKIEKSDDLVLATNGVDKITIDGELLAPGTSTVRVTKYPWRGKVFRASCGQQETRAPQPDQL